METINKAFVYGVSVEGENFTGRDAETRRMKMNFENGLNVILISPRRMGKTSLVRHVQQVVDANIVKTIYIDIYDCRSEYDFYNKFAAAVMKQTATKAEQVMENIKKFLVRVTPKFAFGADPMADYSVSLGITPKEYSPEEILQLPELVAQQLGRHIVVCIDEFQQVGEWPDSLQVQKRLRGVWQHHKNASYCLFGSRQHMMNTLFQNKSMPFYQFGEINYLQPIPVTDWIPFIQQKFQQKNMAIEPEQIEKICQTVGNQSSYVQQLAWNVMLNTETVVGEAEMEQGVSDLLIQCSPLFMEQTGSLSSYQMNMLRAIADGQRNNWMAKSTLEKYNLGSKSNVSKLQETLLERDFIEKRPDGLFLSDTVMLLWIQRNMDVF